MVTPDEADDLAAVHAQAFAKPWDAEAFAELLAGPGVFGFVAAKDAPQGLILCRAAADELEILTVAVAPDARRRGVAKALMTAAIAAARAAGSSQAFLEVAVDNMEAVGLYAGLGFRRSGVRRAYYDRGPDGQIDALVMRLDLAASNA
ncbi:GNAT family N-acetyltransferase [Phenylobacterium immobile]|jgi:ribosomal-protein-alanine N-acetyltransferase|uniref:GNAT family N-acetyltransferase n=1 Tax=Phenylobacterium immobile TaxID=21 RepID=UPI000AC3D966|nr:GNAT family N-acetyltransferase [Phenylobacterium immobile]